MPETHSLPETHHSLRHCRIQLKTDGTIQNWNETSERIFEYSAKEMTGKNISLLFKEDFLEKENRILERVRMGHDERHETECKTRSGKIVSMIFTTLGIKDEEGNVVSISKIGEDITEQKINEEKQAILAAIVSSSDDAIISKTLKGVITSWNEAATRMFGYTADEAIGKNITLIIPKNRLAEEARIITSIRNGEKIDHFETVRIAKDGTKRNLSITVSPLKDNNGKIIGASKIARDISIRKEAEKKQKLYTERLKELNNYKDDFMVMASHELKTPLTVILGNLQLLESMMTDDPRSPFIQKTIKQVNKLSSLISNLLDVSKIQAGKLLLNPSVFDMNDLLTEVISNFQQTTKNHIIEFEIEQDKLMVNADHERIEQVIINLISNAVKYSPELAGIKVKAQRKAGDILVSIHDKGIGIPQKDIENIFLRFYRVSGSASSFSGSGVGLFISSEIVKGHGGKIWAKSRMGKGSDFYFSIPAEIID